MKKHASSYGLMLAFVAVFTGLYSFTDGRGGDVFAIYLNGKQVHHQAIHADKRIKTLELPTGSASDKIEVLYSHCGKVGTGRVLTLWNEKQQLIKSIRFPDSKSSAPRMGFTRKDLGKEISAKLNLYYASKEMPEGKLLATIVKHEEKVMAKR